MNYQLSEEERMLQKTAADFANKTLAAVAVESNENGEFQDDIYKQLGELGFLGMTVPEKYGGVDFGNFSLTLAIEQISKVCASTAVTMSVHNSLTNWVILKYGSDESREKYLPRLASGEILGAYALTEPNAGSDIAGIQTSAVRKDNDYILNGSKLFVSTGDKAGAIIVFVRTDPDDRNRGLSAFIVEPGYPGFSIGKVEKKMGLKASSTVELVFEDCVVPASNLLSEEGRGMEIALSALDGGRIGIASQSLGIGQAAFEEAIKFAGARKQFGKRIIDLQPTKWKLAEIATKLEAARLLVYSASKRRDAGDASTKQVSMAKLFATRAANEIVYDSLQIHGGVGYTSEFLIERLYRDARALEIYEGTSEIQKLVISREILKEYSHMLS
ncbi:MAG: acyl-CoA dehydrogenase family protein [Candidatus Krumholzibacteriota bacterium]|nr:acyl-CoA dehydrogenase family protein [Candidatus Krumholzibacteriota bacterium]